MDQESERSAEQLAAELEEARRRIAALEAFTAGTASGGGVIEHMLDGFSLLTPDGVHLEVNPALCAMTGFSRDELIGAGPPHPYWPPEEYAAIEAAFARTLGGKTDTLPLTFMRKDAMRFPVLVSPSLIRDADGVVTSAFATVKDMTAMRQAEAALAESEQLFRLTFDQAPVGAALVGLDFVFRKVNSAFCRMTEYEPDELLTMSFTAISHPEDAAVDVPQIQRLAAGEIAEYAREKRYVRKSGGIAWGDVVVRPVLGDDDRPLAFLAMVNDITKRRLAEEAVTREKDMARSYLDIAGVLMVAIAADQKVLLANRTACEVLEREESELLGHNWFDVALPAEEREEVRRVFAELMADDLEPRESFENRVRTRNGQERLIAWRNTVLRNDDGEIVATLSSGEDISERRATEDALADTRRLLDESQQIGELGGWEYDVAGVRVKWTDEVYRIHGVEPDFDPNDVARDVGFYAPQDKQAIAEAFQQAVESGTPYDLELEMDRADGRRIWVRTSGRPIMHDGEVVRITGHIMDITEQKQAEAEIRRLNAELEQRVASRTEQRDALNRELEAFAYAASHDLRAPLRAIDGFSAMVAADAGERLTLDDLDHLQRVRSAAQRMGQLIDDILGLSRVTRGEMLRATVDVSALAGEVANELRTENPDRDVEFRAAPDMTAQADAALLRVILYQLLGNAWKFTSKHETALVEVGVAVENGQPAFFVRDDGAGFDMAYAEHIFGAFQRFHPVNEYPGDGIGLATVQRLVARHGGSVWAEAQVEQGATIFFTLPDEAAT
jgi:PAS domain S-box-containing protein